MLRNIKGKKCQFFAGYNTETHEWSVSREEKDFAPLIWDAYGVLAADRLSALADARKLRRDQMDADRPLDVQLATMLMVASAEGGNVYERPFIAGADTKLVMNQLRGRFMIVQPVRSGAFYLSRTSFNPSLVGRLIAAKHLPEGYVPPASVVEVKAGQGPATGQAAA